MIFIVLLVLTILGCNRPSQLERSDREDISLAKAYFDLLRNGQYGEVEGAFDPSLNGSDFHAGFNELVATIPKAAPLSMKPTFLRRECKQGVCNDGIVLEYKYVAERLLFDVALRKEGGRCSIVGMHIHIIPESFIAANEFRLLGKGLSQYVVLSFAILFPAFSLYALVLCIRSRLGVRKWFWALFILIGISRLSVNWTTGQLEFQVFSVQILSATAFGEPYGPWIISASLPLGALLFFGYRKFQSTRSATGKPQ